MRDAASVAVAKQSGCIFIGKTVSTELGHRAPGLTTNPHNKDFTPGGSSSGSAAAVASMMAPVCFGTQTTGSVIRPAAYCGVIGYKPSYGDFDKSGILPNSPSLDTLGLIARSIDDIQIYGPTKVAGFGALAIGSTTFSGAVDFSNAGIVTSTTIEEGNRYMVPPKLTTTERDAQNAVAGAMIYNTTVNKLQVYTGSSWETITSA